MYMGTFNSFFSRKLVRTLAAADYSEPIFSDEYSKLLIDMGCNTVGEGMAALYSFLFKCHRNEYVYKNELFNKIILGIHSPRTSTAFEEMPVANSKADFVVLNGSAMVYEVKTDLDNLQRLDAQIADYYSAFDKVTVVCGLKTMEALVGRYGDSPIGILQFTPRGTLHWCKKPDVVREGLSSMTLFNLLRKAERDAVLEELGVGTPNELPACYARAAYDLFSAIPMSRLYPKCLEVIKRRGSDVDARAIRCLPRELKLPGYFARITDKQVVRLLERLSYPLLGC